MLLRIPEFEEEMKTLEREYLLLAIREKRAEFLFQLIQARAVQQKKENA